MPKTTITYLGHATVVIATAGARIITDPFLRQRLGYLRRVGAPVSQQQLGQLDGVLISHLHRDHCDLPSLRRIGPDRPVVVPAGGGEMLRKQGFSRVEEVRATDLVEDLGPPIRVTEADHARARDPLGPAADPVGYLVEGSERVYFAGDTDRFDGMEDLSPGLDVALLPVGGLGPALGPGHLNPLSAAEVLEMLQPKLAIPIHWGSFQPAGLGWAQLDYLRRPPREFERHATRMAPQVEVRILQAGESVTVGGRQ